MENIEKDKVFFNPGDVVKIKHDLDYNPLMLVKQKEQKLIKDSAGHFLGIRCIWFTKDGLYQEQVFSTKDLSLVKSSYKVEMKSPFGL